MYRPPLIGFDRFVSLEWLQLATTMTTTDDPKPLVTQVSQTLAGKESQRKTIDIVKRLTYAPFSWNKEFINRGMTLVSTRPDFLHSFAWLAATTSYPFFSATSEITGRLMSIQGTCTVKQIQRRMAEKFSERNGIERAVLRVLQSQLDWGSLKKSPSGEDLSPGRFPALTDNESLAWVAEGVVRAYRKSMPIEQVMSHHMTFPIHSATPPNFAISTNANLSLQQDGSGRHFVSLSDRI